VASHKSAEKRARQTVTRTARNHARMSRVKSAVRIFRKAVTGSDKEALAAAFLAATRELRKAASKGVIHKNAASRRVSRLTAAHVKALAQ
jgi:small subunit ribosomal protein S20